MDVEELAAESERKIARLRRQLDAEQQFLADLRRRAGLPAPGNGRLVNVDLGGAMSAAVIKAMDRQTKVISNRISQQALNVDEGRHASREEKRALALAAMRERPGIWKTTDLDDLYRENGIDPKAGTPPKNILWHLK